jgi:hypothetical protein
MPGRKRGGKQKESVATEFHFIVQQAMVAGVLNFPVSPSGFASQSTRAAAMADEYAHFRVNRLRFRLHPSSTGNAAAMAAGYVGGVQDTPPATIGAVMELIPATYLSMTNSAYATATTPSDWVQVPQKDLRGPFPWYKALNGTSDATEEAPGLIVIAGSTTNIVVLEARVELEFKTAVAPANTPLAIQARLVARSEKLSRAMLAERQVLSRILTGAATDPAVPTSGALRP